MLRLTKQVLTVLVSFSGSLACMANVSKFTMSISLNNQSSRPTVIDLNPD